MCSCTLGCMLLCWTLFCSHERFSKGMTLKAVPEPATKPAPKAALKPAPKGKHVQVFRMKRKVGKGFYSVPSNQNESD